MRRPGLALASLLAFSLPAAAAPRAPQADEQESSPADDEAEKPAPKKKEEKPAAPKAAAPKGDEAAQKKDAPGAAKPAAKTAADKEAEREAEEDNAPTGCAPPEDMKPDLAGAYLTGCTFLAAVSVRNTKVLTQLVRAPFYFEGKPVAGLDEVRKKWTQLLGDFGGSASTLYGVEVLPYDEMVKKYGKPPTKLDAAPLRGSVFAVGNIDGHAEIAVLRKEGSSWAVVAFTD